MKLTKNIMRRKLKEKKLSFNDFEIYCRRNIHGELQFNYDKGIITSAFSYIKEDKTYNLWEYFVLFLHNNKLI